MNHPYLLSVLLTLLLIPSNGRLHAAEAAITGQSSPAEQEHFFEQQVRPVLAKHCYACHGPKKQQAGLRLDSQAWMQKGNETGPALVAGNPDKSRLIQVLQYADDDIQMPPAGKLAADQIAALTTWIKIGAPWPKSATPDKPVPANDGKVDYAQARASHWAYRPVQKSAVPEIKNSEQSISEVDQFVLARLEQAGLTLSPRADRRTLIRRVSFGLTGLPPTFAEVAAFEKDEDPQAFANLVDRLLKSPHYGERWARHWLDIARYADTKGYVFTAERRYPYSYTYRDYVVRAFNEDLPYDRFLVEQLAADQIDRAGDDSKLAALGFLTVGRRFRNNTHDIIDDRIDVVTRGLMGLTVTCARCHDHKYDPIPTEDYYSLYGVFASTYEPDVPPLLGEPEPTPEYQKYKAELDKRTADHENYVAEQQHKIEAELRSRVTDYLLQAVKKSGLSIENFTPSFSNGEPRAALVQQWTKYLINRAKPEDRVFGIWKTFTQLPRDEFAVKSQELVEKLRQPDAATGDLPPVNALVKQALLVKHPESLFELAEIYGRLLGEVDKQWQELLQQSAMPNTVATSTGATSTGTASTATQNTGTQNAATQNTGTPNAATPARPTRLENADAEELRQVLYGENSPAVLTADEAQRLFDRAERDKARKLESKIEEWRVGSPDAPPRAMVLYDRDQPTTPHVFIRGNSGRRGQKIPRRFLRLLVEGEVKPFEQGSGRLELARAITDPANPLTARVFVNRVWSYHFGQALVPTPSDFGVRSNTPSHPELLDYLADRFVNEGWSVKQLHRQLLLTATYQQSSDDNELGRKIDPENRLLWRMNRQRLDFEAMRDAMLLVSGRLSPEIGGRPVDLQGTPSTGRRTIYGFVDRNNLPGLFRTFDFASPDASSPGRPQTTVPQQALFAMNAPFAIEQARALASRPEVTAAADDDARIQTLYHLALARPATEGELALAVEFVTEAGSSGETADAKKNDQKQAAPLTAWDQLAQILLLTNEFLFVD